MSARNNTTGTSPEASLRESSATLDLPAADKPRLLEMTPGSYTGLAEQLAKNA